MTDKRIIDLPVGTAPTGMEEVPVWQGGATV